VVPRRAFSSPSSRCCAGATFGPPLRIAEELEDIAERCAAALAPVLDEEDADMVEVWIGFCAVAQDLGEQEEQEEGLAGGDREGGVGERAY